MSKLTNVQSYKQLEYIQIFNRFIWGKCNTTFGSHGPKQPSSSYTYNKNTLQNCAANWTRGEGFCRWLLCGRLHTLTYVHPAPIRTSALMPPNQSTALTLVPKNIHTLMHWYSHWCCWYSCHSLRIPFTLKTSACPKASCIYTSRWIELPTHSNDPISSTRSQVTPPVYHSNDIYNIYNHGPTMHAQASVSVMHSSL